MQREISSSFPSSRKRESAASSCTAPRPPVAASHVERAGSRECRCLQRRPRGGGLDHVLESPCALVQAAADEPVPALRTGEARLGFGIGALDRPRERSVQVLLLVVEECKPALLRLAPAEDVGPGRLGDVEEVPRMAVPVSPRPPPRRRASRARTRESSRAARSAHLAGGAGCCRSGSRAAGRCPRRGRPRRPRAATRRRRPRGGPAARARARRGGRSSSRASRAASAGAAAGLARLRREARAPARAAARSRTAGTHGVRAAASSIASGQPVEPAADRGDALDVLLASARTRARPPAPGSRRDAPRRSPASASKLCVPRASAAAAPGTRARRESRSGVRLVASTRTRGPAARSSATGRVAAPSCSRLSSTSRIERSRIDWRTSSAAGSSSACATVGSTRSGSVTLERSTKTAPSRSSGAIACATASASRVLPVPPGPVSVTSRTSSRRSIASTAAISSLRPTSEVAGDRQGRSPHRAARGRGELDVLTEDRPLELLQRRGRDRPRARRRACAARRDTRRAPPSGGRSGRARAPAARETAPCTDAPRRAPRGRGARASCRAECEPCVVPELERAQMDLLEPRCGAQRNGLVGDVRERRPAPERERAGEILLRLARPAPRRAPCAELVDEPLEPLRVELARARGGRDSRCRASRSARRRAPGAGRARRPGASSSPCPGGASPQRASTRWSRVSTAPPCRRSSASRARCFGPPSGERAPVDDGLHRPEHAKFHLFDPLKTTASGS